MSAMLAIQGLYEGMTKHMIESTLRSESGEVSIFAASYRLHQNLKYHLNETERMIYEMEKIPIRKRVLILVSVALPMIVVFGVLYRRLERHEMTLVLMVMIVMLVGLEFLVLGRKKPK